MVSRRSSFLGVALLSGATLAYEVGLTRLFAVQQFYHFAFLVISLAVLGLAAGGVYLSLGRRPGTLAVPAWGFALAALVAYAVLQVLPFDSYSLAWDGRQAVVLLVYVLSAAAPFFFSGWLTCAAIAMAGTESRLPYAASLLGGSLGGSLALWVGGAASGEAVVFVAASLGAAAAATFSTVPNRRVTAAVVALACLIPAARLPTAWSLRLSPYKPLRAALQAPGSVLRETAWSPTTRLDVVQSDAFHIFPGLRLNTTLDLPHQIGVFLDGEGPYPLTALDPDAPSAPLLAAALPSNLAYRLRPSASTLLLRSAAGTEVGLALASGAASVTAVIEEPLVTDRLRGSFVEQSGAIALNSRVTIVSTSTRSALAARAGPFQVIEFALRDPDRPIRSGAFSLNEEYDLTVEALQQAFDRLTPDGLLMVTRWLGTPPSDESRAWATLLAAADRPGRPPLNGRVLAFRSMRTATLMASPSTLLPQDLTTVRAFLNQNGYDPIYLPGLRPDELNRHNQLPRDVYHEMFVALLEDREATLRSYELDIRPATDDRPFYLQFFRWRQTPEILAELGRTWQPFGGSGFLVLVLLLGLIVAVSVPLVAVPWRRLRTTARPPPSGSRPVVYFAAIGFGYLLIEVSLVQQATRLLDRPAVALTAVLTVLLLASGVGSLLSTRLRLSILFPVLMMTLGLIAWGLPSVLSQAQGWPMEARLAVTAAILCPPGLFMGVPFARGLAATDGGIVPLAWAANGAASGVAGVLAAMVSLSFGLRATLVAGGVAYLVAWWASPERRTRQ
ncbi:MAG TPA: hypothetical protein VLD63_07060 [Anaerolineales bacterium]|nr:hypothetical protein [Anaerolineales bacterium]